MSEITRYVLTAVRANGLCAVVDTEQEGRTVCQGGAVNMQYCAVELNALAAAIRRAKAAGLREAAERLRNVSRPAEFDVALALNEMSVRFDAHAAQIEEGGEG